MFPGTPPVHRGITCLWGSLAEVEELGPGLLLALSPPHLLWEPTALPGPGRAKWPHSIAEPGSGSLDLPGQTAELLSPRLFSSSLNHDTHMPSSTAL